MSSSSELPWVKDQWLLFSAKKWQQYWAGSQASRLRVGCCTALGMEMYPRPRLSSFQPGQRSLVAFFHSGLVSALLVLGQPEHSLASFFEMAWTRHVKRIAAFTRAGQDRWSFTVFSINQIPAIKNLKLYAKR